MELRLSEAVMIELVRTVPAVLWVVFAALVFLVLRRAILPQLGRLSNVKTPVFEATFAEQMLDEAAARIRDGAPASARERRAAISRLEHAAHIVKRGRILWVDDNSDGNSALTHLFRRLGMTVDTARSTDEAMARLNERSYDLIITDMRRDT
ncbi:MAG: response regulator, partial [Micromonosporaceae bacterium]|nr:response regulator [Micromonosporaceae bacterium]